MNNSDDLLCYIKVFSTKLSLHNIAHLRITLKGKQINYKGCDWR